MVLKDERARASGEKHQLAARRCQVGPVWFPDVAPKHRPFNENHQISWWEECAAYRGMQEEGGGSLDAEGREQRKSEYFIYILSNWIVDEHPLKTTPGDAKEALRKP